MSNFQVRAGREGSRERGKGKEEQRRALLEDKFQVEEKLWFCGWTNFRVSLIMMAMMVVIIQTMVYMTKIICQYFSMFINVKLWASLDCQYFSSLYITSKCGKQGKLVVISQKLVIFPDNWTRFSFNCPAALYCNYTWPCLCSKWCKIRLCWQANSWLMKIAFFFLVISWWCSLKSHINNSHN